MMRSGLRVAAGRWLPLGGLAAVLAAALVSLAPAQQPGCVLPAPEPMPDRLTLPLAVRWAIEHNPSLATVRKQHGIAAAGITIANTYPFNPIIQDFVWGDNGPSSAGITNRVFNEHTARLDIEWRGQGRHRRAMAQAVLSRTDWEIAAQEVLTAAQVTRAFQTALHRRERVRVLEQMADLQEEVTGAVAQLVREGQQPTSELALARADLAEARAAVAPARNLLVVAENDLSRLLGVVETPYALEGSLEVQVPRLEEPELVTVALERRPDLHALELAVREADARLRLEVANRYGNPSLGPAFEYNETSVYFIGMWALWQLPIINTRRGEIQQRHAERARAIQAVDSLHVTLRQDVRTALKRLTAAEQTAEIFRTQTIPTLQAARADLDKLFASGQQGVTLARVVGVRTRLLQSYANYLDSLLELALAATDLAAAVGDPSLAQLPQRPPPDSETAPPPRKVGQ